MSERMSLMPLHFTLCKDVICVMCLCVLMAWRVYERMHLANATTYCLRANTSSECNYYELWQWSYTSHITHPTSHITSESVSNCSSHRVLYTGTLHPLPPLFMRHHTNLFLFIAIYYLFEDVILNVMGYRSHVSSVDRSVGSSLVSSRRRAFHVQYRIHLN